VHRQDCPNTFRDRVASSAESAWSGTRARATRSRCGSSISGSDRPSLLADIAKVLAAGGVNVRTAGMQAEDRTVRGVFVIEVPNAAKLSEIINALRKLPGVARVERRLRLLHPPRRPADGRVRALVQRVAHASVSVDGA
jgi:GTP pyrophosphokinase